MKTIPYKLDSLGFIGRGKSKHRPRNDPTLYGGKYPFFQTGDVTASGLYLHRHSQTYNDLGLAQSKIWPPGTLCITIAANIADTAILTIAGCFPDSIVGFIPEASKADVRYIKYYIDTIKQSMQNVSKGTTQDNLSLDKLLAFDFHLPCIETQHRIASILSSYDDLIENNTRRIAILEEMARRIYEEWFVHFRFPGHEQVQLVESELGEIPEGWTVESVASVVQRLPAGQTYKKDGVLEQGHVMVVDQSTSDYLGFHDSDVDHPASIDEPRAIFGDHTCKLKLMLQPFSVGPNTIPFIGSKGLDSIYVFQLVQGLVETREYKRHWSDLSDKKAIVCTKDLAANYGNSVRSLLNLALVLEHKNRNLRTSRDILLPKLISGELDVSEIAA